MVEEQTKLSSINETQKKIQELQIKIATNNTSITETNKYIKRLEKLLVELKNKSSTTEKEDEELSNINVTLTDLKKHLCDLIEEKTYYEAAFNLLKDTGIKTKIVKQYLPIINKLVNKYLASLDFFVNFNLDESFKETIKSRHRDEFTYNNFSEGEKQRIDMALMLTWRAVATPVGGNHNVRVGAFSRFNEKAFDEPEDGHKLGFLESVDFGGEFFDSSDKQRNHFSVAKAK